MNGAWIDEVIRGRKEEKVAKKHEFLALDKKWLN